MEKYMFSMVIIGLATFALPWVSILAKKAGISYAVFYLLAGILLYSLFPDILPIPLPDDNGEEIVHLTELVVIISLMGVGIRIDQPFSFKKWASPLRLVFIAMLLCIAFAAAFGYFVLDLDIATAILLGACLAPTDPVLASDVQVGPPNEQNKSSTKFVLTSEAGLNDGMAFPFTWLAVTVGIIASGGDASLEEWFFYHFLYQIIGGIAIGYAFGKAAGYLVFNFFGKNEILKNLEGFLAISLTLLIYGITELLHAYGFIAVFVCAITFRHSEKEHEYHNSLHSFTDQIEQMFIAVLLLLLGGAVALGILEPLNWKMVVFALLFILLIRPVFAYISLTGSTLKPRQKLVSSFFGIRGMGSLFYLSFGLNEIAFDSEDELWAIVTFCIGCSILIHGLTATTAINYLKEKQDGW
ncbi:cation:proton antiporter [Algoriphagus sp. AGSA1]|uniref:cation:proton antiporter n=1 Tax=Algoriphagus sp. AGSA1 TaxID=2907213 RepID=UPI001F459E3D|nr:cation:proton antiporter [Algoriphagus sp. AGSA1]MCE7055258.1 cation:proton antiporter [Algoriphagus sp. AGSA1]